MTRVFISHRRADSEGHAGRIWDRVVARFGPVRNLVSRPHRLEPLILVNQSW
jgi:hypothetical protein